MLNSIFKIVYFIEVIIIAIVRKIYVNKYIKQKISVDKKTGIETAFLVLSGICMLIPVIYVLSSVLDFANYNLPDWIG